MRFPLPGRARPRPHPHPRLRLRLRLRLVLRWQCALPQSQRLKRYLSGFHLQCLFLVVGDGGLEPYAVVEEDLVEIVHAAF